MSSTAEVQHIVTQTVMWDEFTEIENLTITGPLYPCIDPHPVTQFSRSMQNGASPNNKHHNKQRPLKRRFQGVFLPHVTSYVYRGNPGILPPRLFPLAWGFPLLLLVFFLWLWGFRSCSWFFSSSEMCVYFLFLGFDQKADRPASMYRAVALPAPCSQKSAVLSVLNTEATPDFKTHQFRTGPN